MSKLLLEFWRYAKDQKKFWILPILLVVALFGALIVFGESTVIAPFVYTLF